MPLWTPENMDLALWLDAADTSTVTENATPVVTNWADKSGLGRNFFRSAGTVTLDPAVYNGNSAMYFDGSGAVLLAEGGIGKGAATNVRNFTVFHVAYFDPTGETDLNILRCANGLSSSSVRNAAGMTSIGYRVLDRDTYTAVNYGLPPLEGLTLTCHVTEYLNGQAYIARDGASLANYTALINSGATSPTPSEEIYIGASSISGALQKFKGHICEIIAIDRYITERQRLLIEGYFGHKWGIAGKFRADHPFKAAAPTLPQISGTVTDAAGAAAERKVRLYCRQTGEFLGEALSSSVDGGYSVTGDGSLGEVQRIVLDDANAGTIYNDIIDRVIPE